MKSSLTACCQIDVDVNAKDELMVVCKTYQVQNGVDDLAVGDLSDLDESDQHGEFEAIVHRHRDHFLGPLDVTERRALHVHHLECVALRPLPTLSTPVTASSQQFIHKTRYQ